MDPERWPSRVRELLDVVGVACDPHQPVIEVKQLVTAGENEHFGWFVTAKCDDIGYIGAWTVFGHEPREPQPIAEPAWWAKLDHLPPGGTT